MKFPMDRPVKIVMLGAGGTGGYVAPYLFRLLHMLDTIPFFQDNADDTSRSWIKGLVGMTRTAPIFQSRRRVFF